MPELPAGTVSFLFTDIEGSTQRWEKHHAAMALALARHDALLRGAIQARGGHVFKTIGDAFQVAFGDPYDAILATVDAQRALAAEDWSACGDGFPALRVRMALHVGAAAPEDDGDYRTPLLNRVARLMSAGHGGQVLLSTALWELVRDTLPDGVSLRDLGERRLKDLRRPERVFQLLAPEIPTDFPPLATLDARPNNLPVQLTSFIGREREMAEVKRLLGASHLVTLTGIGGTGKTRLALQAAADLIDDFDHGVWFVDLAPLTDEALVTSTVATVLGLREEPGQSIEATLVDGLKVKRLLLVLDNCEHLVAACAALTEQILRAAPGVRILATSREALAIAGEATLVVPPLAAPDPATMTANRADVAVALTQFEAVRLFIDRAVAVQADFGVTNANAPAVAGICHRLDGIPLAIELAAARVKTLTVQEIHLRLVDRFRLLTGGSRTALPRQQTLRGAIDWSYDLLPAVEQRVMERLAVFAGRCRLEAAEAVCASREVARDDVLDAVTNLAAKSLVVADTEGEVSRYWLLETIRQYALEKLVAEGDEAEARDRHLAWYVEFVSNLEQESRGRDPVDWRGRLKRQHDNLRAALSWGLADPERTREVVALAVPLPRMWPDAGIADMREGHRWLERVRQAALDAHLDETDPEAVAGIMLGAGALIDHFDVELGETRFAEARRLFSRCGATLGEADALGRLGYLALNRNDLQGGESMLEQSLALMRIGGQDSNIAGIIMGLGEAARLRGDLDRAADLLEEAIARATSGGQNPTLVLLFSLHNLGQVELRRGNVMAAAARFTECLGLDIQGGEGIFVTLGLAGLGGVAAALSQARRAAVIFGAADTVLGAAGWKFDLTDQLDWDRNVALARAQLDAASWDAAWAEGVAMTLEDAVGEAMEVNGG